MKPLQKRRGGSSVEGRCHAFIKQCGFRPKAATAGRKLGRGPFMVPDRTIETARRANILRVDWHDCSWSPPVVVQPPRPARRDKTIARNAAGSAYWLSLKSTQNHEYK